MADFLQDYIPFRVKVTQKYNDILVNVFKKSTHNGVVIGKDNWLFYNSKATDVITDEMDDYSCGKQYTAEELERATGTPNFLYGLAKSRGAQFVLFIAPNKSTVYADKMSPFYKKLGDKSRAEGLYEYFTENMEFPVLFPKDLLIEKAKEEKIYFSNDTHWNGLGGFYGAAEIAKTLNLDFPTREDIELISQDSPQDLKGMLGVDKFSEDLDNYIPDYDKIYKLSLVSQDENITHYESENPNGKKMLLMGDSFSEMLVPSLGTTVSVLDATRTNAYPDNVDYDYVVYEIVERSAAIWAGAEN